MIDTCNPAHAHFRLFVASINQFAEAKGMHPDAIEVFQGDYWHHLRNVWFGKIIEHLETSLRDILADDLEKFTGHCV